MIGYLNRSTIARISTRHIHDLTREFTPRSDPRTVKYQYPWYDGQERTDPAKQATRRTIAKGVVHLGCNKRENAT